MTTYKAFDWVEFPEGRARFCGGIRGPDQAGHETFAVNYGGVEYFGEIRKAWTVEDRFDLEVVSFGHRILENVGLPAKPGSPLVADFTPNALGAIEQLVIGLVGVFVPGPNRPFVLNMGSQDEFSGTVRFLNGWALSHRPQEAVS